MARWGVYVRLLRGTRMDVWVECEAAVRVWKWRMYLELEAREERRTIGEGFRKCVSSFLAYRSLSVSDLRVLREGVKSTMRGSLMRNDHEQVTSFAFMIHGLGLRLCFLLTFVILSPGTCTPGIPPHFPRSRGFGSHEGPTPSAFWGFMLTYTHSCPFDFLFR